MNRKSKQEMEEEYWQLVNVAKFLSDYDTELLLGICRVAIHFKSEQLKDKEIWQEVWDYAERYQADQKVQEKLKEKIQEI